MPTGIFLQTPRDTSAVHDDHLDLGSGIDTLDATAPFPLLQRISHPYPHTASYNVSFPNFAVSMLLMPCPEVRRVRLVDSPVSRPRYRCRNTINGGGRADECIVCFFNSWIDRWRNVQRRIRERSGCVVGMLVHGDFYIDGPSAVTLDRDIPRNMILLIDELCSCCPASMRSWYLCMAFGCRNLQ
jgi:hypothetical protein